MKDQIANSENPGGKGVNANPEDASKLKTTKWVITFDEKPITDDEKIINDALVCEENCLKRRIIGTEGLVELWELEGNDIDVRINIQTILAGVNTTNTHTANIGIEFTEENTLNIDVTEYTLPDFGEIQSDQEEILIAVLDTGVSTALIPKEFLWQDETVRDSPCGRSFINNGGAVEDDDVNLHGTLVTGFIINQFKDSGYRVKIMNLKTHDGNGRGDIYSIVDAIHFAMKNGAKIINASWGFYNSELYVDSEIEKLIFTKLFNEGVLFVTVSGNKLADEDAHERYFYPAQFGTGIKDENKNMFVVTTVSPSSQNYSKSQNFSPDWVDLGVPCDSIKRTGNTYYYSFNLPFVKSSPGVGFFIVGTSFATAIASGRIGTYLSKSNFPEIYKKNPFIIKEPVVENEPIFKQKLLDVVGTDLFGQRGTLESGIKGGRVLKRKIISS